MKNFFTIFISFIFISCSNTSIEKKETASVPLKNLNSTHFNSEINIEQITNTIASEIAIKLENNALHISVLNYLDFNGNNSKLGEIISNNLIFSLKQTYNMNILERNDLDKILEEQKYIILGLTSSDEGKKIGRLTSSDIIIIGSIFEEENKIKITTKVISIASGEVIYISDKILTSNSTLRELLIPTIPSWTQSYKKEGYLTAVGISKIKNNNIQAANTVARLIAKSEIAKQINTKIETSVEINSNENISSYSKETSNELLKNIQEFGYFKTTDSVYILLGVPYSF